MPTLAPSAIRSRSFVPSWAVPMLAVGVAAAILSTQTVPGAPVVAQNAPDLDPEELLPPLRSNASADPTPATEVAQFRLVLPAPPLEELATVMRQAGAIERDAVAVANALRGELADRYAQADHVQLMLAIDSSGGGHRIKSLAFLGDLGRQEIARQGEQFLPLLAAAGLERHMVNGAPYWSGRRAGLDPADADALAARVRTISGTTSVEFVTGDRPDRFGSRTDRRLLYLVAATPTGKREFLREDGRWIAVGAVRGGAGFMRPARGRITSSFGWRTHPILRFARPHNGIDIAAPWGAPIYAAADGVVEAAGWRGGYGRQVRIAHGGTTATTYSHLSALAVPASARVRRGQVIGYAGASGLATGPHLHFEVLRNGRPVDPARAELGGSVEADDSAARQQRLRLLRSATPA